MRPITILKNIKSKFNINLSSFSFIAFYLAFVLTINNFNFWSNLYLLNLSNLSVFAKLFTFLILLTGSVYFILLWLLGINTKLLKFTLIIVTLASAIAKYFTDTYNVYIDESMIDNILHTDGKEASNLFSFGLIFYVLLFGILPSLLIYKVKIKRAQKSILSYLLKGLVIILTLLIVLVVTFIVFSKEIITFGRANKNILDKSIPYNYIVNPYYYIKKKIIKSHEIQAKPKIAIQLSRRDSKSQKSKIAVLIIGETARRDNFSLYGYKEQTNPLLSKQDLLIFNNATSCGVNTAVSVPCIFYTNGSEEFRNNQKNYKSYISYLTQIKDLEILWYDNNFGGCYGICKDAIVTNTQAQNDNNYCSSGECLDEILTQNLESDISKAISSNKDALIVLHQNGSHGPLYYKRYPKEFAKFLPYCKSPNPQDCTRQELINAYNNTILYTDFVIDKTIKILQKFSKEEILLIYASDHGESLGENRMYLHGMPYKIAPKEQKEIPLIVWLSKKVLLKYNKECLIATLKDDHSHDNIINTLLGFFNISSPFYKQKLDLLNSTKCQNAN